MALDASVLARMKASKNKYSRGGNTVKLKEGKTRIRLLAGEGQFWREIGVHWIKTEKDGKPVAVTGCYDEVHGKPCAICAAADKAMAAGTDEEKAIMKEWRAKKSVLVHAIIRDGADKSDEPQILELTGTTWAKISGVIEEYFAADQNILDPKTGIDLIIERTGKGLNTEYNPMVSPGSSKPVPAEVLTRLPSFEEYVEKELFRGDDRKALTAIANFSGVSVSGLTAIAGPRSTTAMLTSSTVEDAEVTEVVETAAAEDTELAKVAEELVAEAATVESDDEREEREAMERLAAIQAKKAKAEADKKAAATASKPATPAKPAPAPAPAKDAFTGEASQDEIDALLADLDG